VQKNRNKKDHHKKTAKSWKWDVCNACSIEAAEEAEAHETLCTVKKSLVAKWTCDVCKSCTFGTLAEAEAHERKCHVHLLAQSCPKENPILKPCSPEFKQHLMCIDTTAKYCIYLSLCMSCFVRIKGCVNIHETTPVHEKHVLMRHFLFVTWSDF
jgi:hypothetical protein